MYFRNFCAKKRTHISIRCIKAVHRLCEPLCFYIIVSFSVSSFAPICHFLATRRTPCEAKKMPSCTFLEWLRVCLKFFLFIRNHNTFNGLFFYVVQGLCRTAPGISHVTNGIRRVVGHIAVSFLYGRLWVILLKSIGKNHFVCPYDVFRFIIHVRHHNLQFDVRIFFL